MKRLINELHFINSPKSVDTIEVDIDSLPKGYYDYIDIVTETLRPLAQSSPDLRATIYVQQALSVNFGHSGCSIFIGVVGSPNALELILNGFQSIPGIGARYGDSIFTNQSRRRLHIEDGLVWQQEDDVTWFVASSIEGIAETDDESDQYGEQDFEHYPSQAKVYETGDLLKKTAKAKDSEIDDVVNSEALVASHSKDIYTRSRSVRADARVGSIRTTIEGVFGLPEGSVKLCDPEGNSLRADAKISTLRRRWDE
ncbi:hypothetical protein OA5_06075 [Vibrio cyclitrophicus 1F111]|uniref:hypothetical protein n=1 Tax=Vibrio cyclitrophicus TaxID=47951 RepID=UPI00031914D3|nr:hypothetical protein [Vibrio cyclitrophicus]OEF75441.1 hypothetical protein OA5_06075 [Vibrio cyclitrophicus 1F111]PMI44526.1 hypothetical protein BCU44_16805 [Vibrio cyclitrophicus]